MPDAEPPTEYALEDLEIGLRRTACLISCPVYQFRISGDGRVVYEGRENVRVTGTHESIIDKSAVLRLLRQIYIAHFFELRDSYQRRRGVMERDGDVTVIEEIASDLSSTIVTVRIRDYEKRVEQYLGGPSDLINLIELIEKESGVEQWIK